MCPQLFEIGPFTVYSYGLMLGIGFIVASYLLSIEFKRKKIHTDLATEITLLALIFGIIGAKMFHLFETWDTFIQDPIGEAFSAGGLTWYGGFILAVIAIWINSRRRNLPFFVIADSVSPALAIGYGIGRMGCHLAGDGDYGIPTTLPWGTDYSAGTYPPSLALKYLYPDGNVPEGILCHPTPVYEFILAVIIFLILWKIRKKNFPDGNLFMYFLILHGLSRFAVEFIRINPQLLFGLSEAQIISVILILIGITGIIFYKKKSDLKRFDPTTVKYTPKPKK
ncbi:MAG: prolipoprotein diacylglyceryl transferase [Ignavibacteria bacterium]|nr:prolipoprotein diacylglyceryl transferase [Ignavibacteria bacterium]